MVLDVHARARGTLPRSARELQADPCHEAPDVQGAAVVPETPRELREDVDEEETECF